MRNKGMAFIGALMVLIVISALTLTMVTVIASQTRSTNWNINTTRAYFAAEAGLEWKISEINNSESGDEAYDPLNGDINGSQYSVITQEWNADGVDNNSDGQVDDATENGYFSILATGTCGRAIRILRAIGKQGGAEPPGSFAAIHLYNPEDENGDVYSGCSVNFSGRPPHIDGRDTLIPKNKSFDKIKARDVVEDSGSGRDVLAVATHDDQSVADIIDEADGNENLAYGIDVSSLSEAELEEYFTSENPPELPHGGPSVGNIVNFDPLNAQGIVDMAGEYAAMASSENVFDSSNYPHGRTTFGTLDSPQITVINNDSDSQLVIAGNISGTGILVISGNVRFNGSVNFAGMMFIISDGTSGVEMRGTPLIFGSIYAACANSELEGDMTILDFRGTPDVYYSTEAMQLAQTALGGSGSTEILAVTEVGAGAN